MQPQKVLGKEREVDAHKHDKELYLGPAFRQGGTREGGESKRHTGEDGKNRAYREDVMEVRDDVVGVMESDIQRGVSQHNPGEASDGK